MSLMLDTDLCIHLIRHKPPELLANLRAREPGALTLSAITVAELHVGTEKSSDPARNAEALALFLHAFTIASFDATAAAAYGGIRAALESAGTPIGGMDMLIAAHAISLNAQLLTRNVREFERVAGLAVERWG